MQLLNRHRPRPCNSFSFAIVILAGFVLDIALAEYDCSAKDDGWYYDPEFCHIYWRCIHGTAEEFECASGTAWDHHANRCNWLDSIDCSRAEKTTPEPMSDDDDGSEPIDGHGNHVDEGDDAPPTVVRRPKLKKTKYRKTDPEKRILGADKKKDIDDDDLILLIISHTSSSTDFLCAGRDGFFADPEYCTRYYRCSHGVDEIFECPRGTAWDEVTKSCAWVDQVNCDQKKLGYSTSTSTEDTTTSHKKSDVDSILLEPNTPSTAVETNGKDSSVDPSVIQCQPTGIYAMPDPNECNAYYQCEKGIRTRMTCPERQLFDLDKRECNEYERVFCGARNINAADKNQCINKRDGIHPDTERDCHYYYQCIGQNKLREAKCSGDQKFSTYTGRCGPASSAPMPCGSYIPGSTATKNHWNMGMLIYILLSMIVFFLF